MTINIPSDVTNRLKSRKLWMVVAYGFVNIFLDELGIDISEAELENLTYVILAYLGLQGGADAVKEYRNNRGTSAD